VVQCPFHKMQNKSLMSPEWSVYVKI